MTDYSPASLIAGLVAGDDRALGGLYDAYGGVAYGLAFAITGAQASAESVVSESFSEAYRTAASFGASQTSVLAWLTAIVRRNALGMRRNAERTIVSGGNGLTGGLGPTVVPTPATAAMRTLTASQRQVIELIYYRGFTVRQMATHLGQPENGARELLRSAMQELRTALSGVGDAAYEDHVVTRA